MSYYFPLGGAEAITITNVSTSFTAITASVPYPATITALTASYATAVKTAPANGTAGANQDPNLCGTSTTKGANGVQGPTGSVGTDNVTCPNGTVECPGLVTSLSMALPGFPNGINFVRPSGSKFSKVCMEIPVGCTSATATCPPYLPTASITSTFPAIS